MLDSVTKKRINDLRNILVGKIPDPKSQIEQITTGLIYKFMYDMDVEADKMEGVPSFFVGDYEKYSWENLFDPKLGGEDKVKLYSDAIENMYTNPTAPPLFREIFKNSFLPFKDPSTLNMFLKEINEFHYSHSEKLGDAYEHLLSFMGSQGGAGQFRTPRHIIDFIVEIVNPQKNETILDPACGTAGFLISSFKHILTQNTNKKPGDKLTAAERKQIGENLVGYDISPDMTRISLVNMFLHRFKNPQIHEYDTLSSEDRWNEYYDVILANPPFFSPTGGIQPHSRFGVQSKRAEVLFVDYIMEHLTPAGRAGIIVPEGIIFQSQNAHKQLRRLLVENYLVAVVSLPAGVFNPYSGVKTSILILDRPLAKKTDRIAFFKVEQDGFDLGAKRTPIDRSDLPRVCAELTEYLNRLRAGKSAGRNVRRVAEPQGEIQQPSPKPETGMIAEKAKIVADGEYNLSGERYRESGVKASEWPMVKLGDVCEIKKGTSITRKKTTKGLIPVIAGGQTPSYFHNSANRTGETITVSASGAYAGFVAYWNEPIFASDCSTIKPKDRRAITKFVFHVLKFKQSSIYGLQAGAGQPHVYPKDLFPFQIPLPPLETQQALVERLRGYQNVIDGAQAVLDHYRPHIAVDPKWPLIRVDELCELGRGRVISKRDISANPGEYPVYSSQTSNNGIFGYLGSYDFEGEYVTWTTDGANAGTVFYRNDKFNCTNVCGTLKCKEEALNKVDMKYLAQVLGQMTQPYVVQVGNPKLMNKEVARIEIPLPPLKTQQALVAEIEAEQALVNAYRELTDRMQNKIQDRISKVWGE